MLRDIGHLRTDYASDMDNLAADFYDPCLRNADQYDRISGFFSSTIFYLLHSALGDFVLTNHGRMRFICSPRLSQSDADGILFGYHARDQRELAEQLERELEEMLSSEHLSDGAHLLASLIASGRMEVRFAVVSDTAETPTRRMFHDKVGLFIDERGDRVGFRGSANETFFGVSSIGNIESIDVWPSWEGGRDLERVTNASARFERLWNDEVTGVRVVSLPEEFRATLEVTAEGSDIETLLSKLTGPKDSPVASPPQVGDIFLRDHQIRAIEKWEANDFIGILAHATGSGKTITALYALQMAMDRQLTPIVFVPSKLLLEQWAAQLSTLGIGVVRVGAGHTKWISQGSVRAAIEASAPDRRFAVVATLASAGSEQFKNQVVSKASHVLAIFDEAHRAGAPMSRQLFEWFRPNWRLGLSATPERANDPEGTSNLLSYFHGIVDRYSLKDALDDGVLTPYRYQPAWVGLQDHEIDEWERLTLQIQKLHSMSKAKGSSESVRERLRMKLIERSRIAKNASRKIPKAVELIANMYDPRLKEKWLVYCDNQTQLREVRRALASRGIDSWEYHSEMPGDPEATLSLFDINGGIVVAIKCLDEGVDIPSATHALILASSRNPREFIQRRGRVLRRSPSKSIATLLDVLVLPEAIDAADPTWGLVVGELARARQFAAWAVTQDSVSAIEDKWVSMGLTLDQFDALVGTGIEGDDDSGD